MFDYLCYLLFHVMQVKSIMALIILEILAVGKNATIDI